MNHSRNLQHLIQIHITGQACFKTFRKLISLLHVHVQQSNKAPAPIIEDMETESLVGPEPNPVLVHSVQFVILGLPLFGKKKLPQAAARIFQLKMIHFMVKQSFIKKKNLGTSGKACFSTVVCFPF